MFLETKRLSAEDASRVFDYDRKGRPLGKKAGYPDNGFSGPENEKKCPVFAIEYKNTT